MDKLPVVFRWVLRASLMASVLTLVIISLKYVLRDKLGVRWHYAVWFIVIIRLLLPFAPPSHVSLFNFFVALQDGIFDEVHHQVQNIQHDGEVVNRTSTLTDGEKRYGEDDMADFRQREVNPETRIEDKAQPENEAQRYYSVPGDALLKSRDKALEGLASVQGPVYGKRSLTDMVMEALLNQGIYQAVYYLWLAGVVLLGLYMIAVNIELWQHLKGQKADVEDEIVYILEECKSLLGIRRRVEVRYTDRVKVPMLFGVMAPKVLIPTSIKKDIILLDMKHIFLHELAHLKRGDVIVSWLANVLQILHWFNPIIWLAFAEMRQDREIACDATVLYYLQENEKGKYGQALLDILAKGNTHFKLSGLTGIAESKSQVKRRIKMIASFDKRKYKWSLVAILILMLMGCTMLTDPAKQDVSKGGHGVPSGEIGLQEKDDYDIDYSALYSNSVLADPVFEYELQNWFIKAGYIAQQGEWVYFYGFPLDRKGGAYSLSSGPIYRVKLDGSDKAEVVDGDVRYVGMHGDWLYYKEGDSLYGVDVENGEKALLAQNAYGSVAIGDEWIFVVTHDGIIRMRHDGRQKELFVEGYVGNLLVHDGWVYYTTEDSLNRISVDGRQSSVLSKGTIGNIGIWGDKLYYTVVFKKEQTFQPQTYYEGVLMRIHDVPYIILDADVYRMNPDGMDKEKVAKGNLGGIIDGWLITYLYNDNNGWVTVCRKEVDGNGKYRYRIEFLDHDWNPIIRDSGGVYKEFRIDGKWLYQWEGDRLAIRALDRLKTFKVRQTQAGVIDDEQEKHKIAASLLNREFYEDLKGIYQDENWIYYFNPYTSNLCRVSKDGKENQLVLAVDRGISIIGVKDGWVYLNASDSYFFDYGIFRMNINGDGEMEKVLEGYFSMPVLVDGWLYAIYDGALYRINLDTGNKVKLLDEYDSIFVEEFNERIYFTLGKKLYRIGRDGSGLSKLVEYNEDHVTLVRECGEWVYYQAVSNMGKVESLYRVKQDGTYKEKVSDFDANYYVIHGEWIYYAQGTDIYRMKLDGSQKAKVYQNDNAIISVASVTNEGMYFTEYIDASKAPLFFAYSKLDFDGINKVRLYNRYEFYKELEKRGLTAGQY